MESSNNRVKPIIGSSSSSKSNKSKNPDMPRNVRFDLKNDDADIVQPTNNRSLRYYCELCDENTQTYRKHLKHHFLFHAMKATRKKLVHFWLEPDVSDHNNRCRACERSYSTAVEYRCHLRNVHCMPIEDAVGGRPKKTPSLSNNQASAPAFGLDLDDINLYCRPCNKIFQNRQKYRLHRASKHDEILIKHPDVLPEWNDPTGYCRSCEHTFSSRDAFHRHCKVDHKMDASGQLLDVKQQQLPDPLDPNFHCSACDIRFKDRKSYRRHCRYQHAMDLAPAHVGPNANDSLLPDVHDKNHHCKPCDKTFPTKISYWRHIRSFHHVKTKALSKATLPDVNDPNNYCCSCDKTYKKRQLFNNHLRKVHSLKTPIKKTQ